MNDNNNNLLNSFNYINNCLDRILNSCQNSLELEPSTKDNLPIKLVKMSLTNEIELKSIKNLRRIDNTSRVKLGTPNATSKALTVEELFHNLALDCDEKVKELDEMERLARDRQEIQIRLLQEIQINSLILKFKSKNASNSSCPHSSTSILKGATKKSGQIHKRSNVQTPKIYVKFSSNTLFSPYFRGNSKKRRCLCISYKHLPELLEFCHLSGVQHRYHFNKHDFKDSSLFKRTRSRTHEIISLNPKEQPLIYTSSIEMKQLEFEVFEACNWLNKVGFSNFVDMYKHNKFPINYTQIQALQETLDKDDMKSLIKRLEILNKSTDLKINYLRLSKLLRHDQQQQQKQHLIQLLNNQDDDDNSSTEDTHICIEMASTKVSQSNASVLQRFHSFQAYGVKSYLHHRPQNSLLIDVNDTKSSTSTTSSSDGYFSSTLSTPNAHKNRSVGVYDNLLIETPMKSMHTTSYSETSRRRLQDESQDSGYGNSPPMRKISRQPQFSFTSKSFITQNVKHHFNALNVKEIQALKAFSLFKVTSLIEKYSDGYGVLSNVSGGKSSAFNVGWKGFRHRFIRKNRHSLTLSDLKHKKIFGVPFKINIQRLGQPLPEAIIQIMRFLGKNAHKAVGIFRKSGSKSRMNVIREQIENGTFVDPNVIAHDHDLDSYIIDLADILKQYFRELPECLLTNKISQNLIDIFTHFPSDSEKFKALQYCLILIDDENRYVLKHLLHLLNTIASFKDTTKMDTKNISTCLAPSLISMTSGASSLGKQQLPITTNIMSSSYTQGVTTLHQTSNSLNIQCNAALDCLSCMIDHSSKLFKIPMDAQDELKSHVYPQPSGLLSILKSKIDLSIHLNEKFDEILKDCKSRSWSTTKSSDEIDVSYKNLNDECPLRVWKLTLDVEAQARDVLGIVLDRSKWDKDLLAHRYITKIDSNTDIIQYSLKILQPQETSRDFCELRAIQQGARTQKFSYLVYGASVEREMGCTRLGDIQSVILKNAFYIEQLDSSKCRLCNIFRCDYKGFSPEWYHRIQPLILRKYLLNIKDHLMSNNKQKYETKV